MEAFLQPPLLPLYATSDQPVPKIHLAGRTLKVRQRRFRNMCLAKTRLELVARRWTWPSWTISRKKRYRTPIITSRLNDYPKGYPNVAAFLDSDGGFSIYRRFGFLQSRILLGKQEDLRRAEKKLKRIESEMTTNNVNALCSRDIRGAYKEKHKQLLADIEQKFCSYCKCCG